MKNKIVDSGSALWEKRVSRALSSTLIFGTHIPSSQYSDHDHPLFLGPLDHCANVQLRPDLQTGSPDPAVLLDPMVEDSTNTVGVCTPAVCQYQQRAQGLDRSMNLQHQAAGQAAIT